ncbi:MAG TPA: hypothetical protein VLH08_16095 [Acidobacteriota bacterium]|nr:hypothetical protein [Acidobacteriota bacterium]
MGFSNSPHELSSEGRIQAQLFLDENSDILLEDFAEGVPWEESLHDRPYPPEVLTSLRVRKRKLKGKKLFIHISPFNVTRTGLARYWPRQAEEALKEEWKQKTIGDEEFKISYQKFCLELIRRFEPEYLAYAVDVNLFAQNRPNQWKEFVQFARDTYTELKKEYPDLPIFLNFNAGSFWKNPDVQEKLISEVLPYSDFIAVSAYPALAGLADVEKLPKDFFSRIAKLDKAKPFAIAETGYPLPAGNTKANPQDKYLEFVLKESSKLDAEFVVWFHYRDFTKIAENAAQSLKSTQDSIKLLDSRKDYGLVDDAGKPKTSHALWKSWFHLPVLKNPGPA